MSGAPIRAAACGAGRGAAGIDSAGGRFGQHLGADPAFADPLATKPAWTSDDRLAPGIYPAAPVPDGFGLDDESGAAPFDVDWSVGLRGTLTKATSGDSFVTTLTPRASVTRQSATLDATIDASADISKPLNGEVTLSRLDLSISGSRALDSLTTLKGNAALNINRQLSGSPGLDPVIIDPPSIVGGTFGLGLDREFGRFNVGVAGSATRTVYGATNRTDTGVTDNSDQNLWSTDATLRVGYQVTPIFEVFGQGGIGRDMFDNPSRSLGVRTDATDQTLRGGITGTWGNVLTATASVGVGRRDFDAAGIADVTTQLYDASVTFSPDETLRLTGALSSAITPRVPIRSAPPASRTPRPPRSTTPSIPGCACAPRPRSAVRRSPIRASPRPSAASAPAPIMLWVAIR